MKKTYDCGIDLGTTNSCIAKAGLDNICNVIEDSQRGSRTIPSVVWINKKGGVIVGSRAYGSRDFENVRREFKRDMGTDTVYSFPNSGVNKTPIELSSEILSQLRTNIQNRYINDNFLDVIITVPAAFSMVQCDATKKAANLSGFRKVILLQEPIAASIAYGAKPNTENKKWMIFDFGGGTLDVSIISTKDGYLDNLNNRGDNHLGGKDIDRQLYESIILPKMQQEYDLPDGLSQIDTARIMHSVEQTKIELSTSESALFYPEDFDDVTDDSGNIISFECTITRSEFEDAIKPLVHKSIEIARKSLNESGLSDSDINKILLVGGTTFIPLVRNELRREFSIELDCSLNPMTVVAEGAALFANTQSVDVEEDDIFERDESDSSYELKYDYNFNTSLNTENICGTIKGEKIGIQKVMIDCIASENSQNPLWSSGWHDVLNSKNGVFDIDVKICTPNSKNLYKISAMNENGELVQLDGYIFSIVHSSSTQKILNPPIPYNIGVLAVDDSSNVIQWMINKGTKLPIEAYSSSLNHKLVLSKSLDPSIEDDCVFEYYEGEIEGSCNPKMNHHIGSVTISSSDLTRKLPMGTEVEIKIDIDISRLVKVSAYIPDYDIVLFEGEELDNFHGTINVLERMTDLEEDLENAEYTLDNIDSNFDGVSELQTRLDEISNDYDKYLDLVDIDNDSVIVFINKFYELETDILKLQARFKKLSDEGDKEEFIQRANDNICKYGTSESKYELLLLKKKLEQTSNPEGRRYLEDRIDNLESDVVFNSYGWLSNQIEYYLMDLPYIDKQKAEYWKNKAMEALSNRETDKLRDAYFNLINLLPRNTKEVRDEHLADLKIMK